MREDEKNMVMHVWECKQCDRTASYYQEENGINWRPICVCGELMERYEGDIGLEQRYMSWFRELVTMGWICSLYNPPEILANYLLHFRQFTPYGVSFPHDHIERFMIEVTQGDWMRGDSEKPTLAESVEHFNRFYADRRMDFGVYVGVH